MAKKKWKKYSKAPIAKFASALIPSAQIQNLDILSSSEYGIIAKAKASSKDAVPLADYKAEMGTTGLHVFGGRINQEFLLELQGIKGYRTYEEMRKNDPVIGGLLFAIEMAMRRVNWFAKGVNDDDDQTKATEFLDQCKDDMSLSWNDFISEALTFLPFGWSYFEIVFKERKGRDGGDNRSKYDDGKIGWRKFGYRPPDTLEKWEMDQNGGIKGMWQRDIYAARPAILIPIEKSILFRTRRERNNPEGLALSPDTLVPTPDGWKTMDDLQEGDKVFDENGRIRYVVATAEWADRPRYKLTFSSGDSIIADENHLWATSTAKERYHGEGKLSLRSTKEIADTVISNTNKTSNHAIRRCMPLEYSSQYLPIEPYILGFWLGDGSSRGGVITNNEIEAGKYFAEAGYGVSQSVNRTSFNWRLESANGKWQTGNLSEALRTNNLLMNKHIPRAYLESSTSQRLNLLRGLMDSDGYVDKFGRCEFYTTLPHLAEGVQELIRTLGGNAKIVQKMPIGERDPGKLLRYIVKFNMEETPVRLERKVNRFIAEDRPKRTARKWHYITKVEKIGTGPTKCIQVDSPSGLFLASKSCIPTHNSILRNSYKPYFFKKELEKFEAIALERTGAGIPVIKLPLGYTRADLETAKQVVRRIRVDEQMGVTLPPGWELELLRPSGRAETQTYEIAIDRYASHILMSLLLTFIALGTKSVGSFALVKAQQDFFRLALVGWVGNMAETLNMFAVRQLFELNAGSFSEEIISNPPQLKTTDIGEYDLDSISQFIQRAGASGFLTPDDATEDYLRRILGLPALEDIKDTENDRDEMRASAMGIQPEVDPLAQGNTTAPKNPSEEGGGKGGSVSNKPKEQNEKISVTVQRPYGNRNAPAKVTTSSNRAVKKAEQNDKILRQRYRELLVGGVQKVSGSDLSTIRGLIEEVVSEFAEDSKARQLRFRDDGLDE